jgi:hypothetical protein
LGSPTIPACSIISSKFEIQSSGSKTDILQSNPRYCQ